MRRLVSFLLLLSLSLSSVHGSVLTTAAAALSAVPNPFPFLEKLLYFGTLHTTAPLRLSAMTQWDRGLAELHTCLTRHRAPLVIPPLTHAETIKYWLLPGYARALRNRYARAAVHAGYESCVIGSLRTGMAGWLLVNDVAAEVTRGFLAVSGGAGRAVLTMADRADARKWPWARLSDGNGIVRGARKAIGWK